MRRKRRTLWSRPDERPVHRGDAAVLDDVEPGVACLFRRFLVGDAGHLSSPFGGEGLNSGLHDAHNIAWKLAMPSRPLSAFDSTISDTPARSSTAPI